MDAQLGLGRRPGTAALPPGPMVATNRHQQACMHVGGRVAAGASGARSASRRAPPNRSQTRDRTRRGLRGPMSASRGRTCGQRARDLMRAAERLLHRASAAARSRDRVTSRRWPGPAYPHTRAPRLDRDVSSNGRVCRWRASAVVPHGMPNHTGQRAGTGRAPGGQVAVRLDGERVAQLVRAQARRHLAAPCLDTGQG